MSQCLQNIAGCLVMRSVHEKSLGEKDARRTNFLVRLSARKHVRRLPNSRLQVPWTLNFFVKRLPQIFITNPHNALAITIIAMAVIAMKSAGRAVIRRTHFSNLQPNICKRHSTNNARPKDDPSMNNGTAIPVPNTVANLPLWQRLGPLSRGFQAYGRSQRKRPYATQFVSSMVIYFLGDLSAQNINGDDYDPKRTLRALIISAGSSIPSYKW